MNQATTTAALSPKVAVGCEALGWTAKRYKIRGMKDKS